MQDKADKISERLLNHGVEIIKLTAELNKTFVGKHVAGQLLRSATSVGANYEEARGAQSKADFIHKLQISLKEIRESLYWLKLVRKSEIMKCDLDEIISETQQINNIIAKSIITAKKNKFST